MNTNMKVQALMARVSTKQLVQIEMTLSKRIDDMREAGKGHDTGDLIQAHVWVCDELYRREPDRMEAWYDNYEAPLSDFIPC